MVAPAAGRAFADPASLYFDVNGQAAGAGIVAGTSYTWDDITACWSTDVAGAVDAQTWDPAAVAVFSAGPDSASLDVRLRNSQAVAGIDVRAGSPVLRGTRVVLGGGTINVAAGQTLTLLNGVAGTTFTKTGPGTVALTAAASNFVGGLAVGAGVLQFPGENAAAPGVASYTGQLPASPVPDYVRLDGGTLRDTNTAASAVFLDANKGISLGSAGGTIDIPDVAASNFHTYHGVISGSGPLAKLGAGTLLLGPAPSTYAGATTITEGSVRLAATDVLPTATSLTIAAGATLDLASFNQTVASLSGAGQITGAGRITVTTAAGAEPTWAGTIVGNGGGLTVGGAGFLRLPTAQNYPGPTIITGSAGSFGIRLATANAIPATAELQLQSTSAAAGPTLDLNGFNQTLNLVTATGPGVAQITNSAPTPATFTAGGTGQWTLAAALTGNLALTKSAPQSLYVTGSNSYTGATRVTAGTLVLTSSSSLGAPSPANATITVANGAGLRFDAPLTLARPFYSDSGGSTLDTGANNVTLAGDVTGAGPVSKAGAGTLTVGSLSIPSLTVAGGTLRLTPGGPTTSRIGSPTLTAGRLDLSDNRAVFPTLNAATICTLLSAGRTGTSVGDWLGTTGITSSTAAASTGHNTAIAYATAAQLGVTFWGSQTNLTGPEFLTRYTFYGDANLDGILNADDYALIDKGFRSNGTTWNQGDFNYDGRVTSADYLLLDTAYLSTRPPSADFLSERESQFGPAYVDQLLASVPEPLTLSAILYPLSSLLLTRQVFLGIRRPRA